MTRAGAATPRGFLHQGVARDVSAQVETAIEKRPRWGSNGRTVTIAHHALARIAETARTATHAASIQSPRAEERAVVPRKRDRYSAPTRVGGRGMRQQVAYDLTSDDRQHAGGSRERCRWYDENVLREHSEIGEHSRRE